VQTPLRKPSAFQNQHSKRHSREPALGFWLLVFGEKRKTKKLKPAFGYWYLAKGEKPKRLLVSGYW
jgi:hypothetical protein